MRGMHFLSKKIISNFLLIIFSLFLMFSTSFAADSLDQSETLIQNLTNAHGAPGFENSVRRILKGEWAHYLPSLKLDGMKNIIGEVSGSDKAPRVLVMAHMDEVGFYVKSITKDGYLRIDNAGGWFDQVVLAHRWKIMTGKGPVLGYTGMDSPHSMQDTNLGGVIPHRNMFIDIGAKSKKEAIEKYGIRPGLPITPDSSFAKLNSSGRYLAKGLDDRVGLAVMTEVLKELKGVTHPNTIIYVATVQEEVGLRGAQVIYQSVKPDIVINLEASIARDFPLLGSDKQDEGHPRLGAGPAIFAYDHSMIPDNNLVEWIMKLAKEKHIPYQIETEVHYGEDGRYLQAGGKGIPVINLGIPVRYAHQDSGVLQRTDYDESVKLLKAILLDLNESAVNEIKTNDDWGTVR